jgi:hypothetical protein
MGRQLLSSPITYQNLSIIAGKLCNKTGYDFTTIKAIEYLNKFA